LHSTKECNSSERDAHREEEERRRVNKYHVDSQSGQDLVPGMVTLNHRHYDVRHRYNDRQQATQPNFKSKFQIQISNPPDLDPNLNPYNFTVLLSPRRVWSLRL
jgi:hypothetical protein